MTNDRLDPISGRRVPGDVPEGAPDSGAGSGRAYPDPGDVDPTVADAAYALDDTEPVLATSGQTDSMSTYGAQDPVAAAPTSGRVERDDAGADLKGQARQVAEHAVEQAADVRATAVEKAKDVKDAALERGADVAEVAKDELARLAGEAREQFQGLWHQASGQLREQAGTGKQQLADLLHSLAAELGEMASKSEQDGPLTALARQASYRGGELSHWLAEAEPSDVLTEIKRFARRRPFTFLAGAAVAGVVVGRLSRGLMAANDSPPTASSGARAAGATDAIAPVVAEDLPAYGGGTAGQTYGYTPVGESR